MPTSSSSSIPLLPSATKLVRKYSTSIPVPFPPPACVLREAGLSRLFARGRNDSRDVSIPMLQPDSAIGSEEEGRARSGAPDTLISIASVSAEALPSSGPTPASTPVSPLQVRTSLPRNLKNSAYNQRPIALDAHVESAVAADGPQLMWRNVRTTALHASDFSGVQPDGEVWSVIDDVVHPSSVLSQDWNIAMHRLVGIIVKAAVDNVDAGIGLLQEAIRRMREPARPQHVKTAIFTLVSGISDVRAEFATSRSIPGWRNVEQTVLAVFSKYVENMAAVERTAASSPSIGAHRNNADKREVASDAAKDWEQAVLCAMSILGVKDKSEVPARYQRPSLLGPTFSMRALIALAKRISASMHPLHDRVLIGEEIWRGFRESFDEDDDTIRLDVEEDLLYGAHGGIQTIIELYTSCRSLVARRRMFALILEVAVSRVRSRASGTGEGYLVIPEEQVSWLYAILWANDAGDALASSFRRGPEASFVVDTLRHLLFEPLSASLSGIATANRPSVMPVSFAPHASDLRDQCRRSGHFAKDASIAGGEIEARMLAAAHDHRTAVIAANRLLHKHFVLSVLVQLEDMAKMFQKLRQSSSIRHEIQDYLSLDEQPGTPASVVDEVDAKVEALRASGRASSLRSVRHVWQTMHSSVCKMVRLESTEHVLSVIEHVLSLILLPMPFTSISSQWAPDSEAEALLAGERRVLGLSSTAESADMLIVLLQLSAPFAHLQYASELRQALIEVLGSTAGHAHHAARFKSDADPAVAHRAHAVSSFHKSRLAAIAICN
jgi:hypothetical protein